MLSVVVKSALAVAILWLLIWANFAIASVLICWSNLYKGFHVKYLGKYKGVRMYEIDAGNDAFIIKDADGQPVIVIVRTRWQRLRDYVKELFRKSPWLKK